MVAEHRDRAERRAQAAQGPGEQGCGGAGGAGLVPIDEVAGQDRKVGAFGRDLIDQPRQPCGRHGAATDMQVAGQRDGERRGACRPIRQRDRGAANHRIGMRLSPRDREQRGGAYSQ